MEKVLEIMDLHVNVEEKPVLKGINLKIKNGEIHVIMGPNASGKSTLAKVIMGNQQYEVIRGDIRLNGESILNLEPEERAKKGIFLAFQYPVEISGVKTLDFLKTVVNNIREARGLETLTYIEFINIFKNSLKELGLNQQFMYRYLNEDFSGGEKKRFEIVQMLLIKPDFAILDEVDSGLDIDSIKIVAKAIKKLEKQMGTLLITHYQRILDYIEPTHVHVMIDGKIVLSGDKELPKTLEEKGYKWLSENLYNQV